MLREHPHRVFCRERQLSRQELIEDDAEGVDIGLMVHPRPANLLGRHILRCAEDHAGARQRLPFVTILFGGFRHLGDTEIEELHVVSLPGSVDQHDVVGLEIPVNDASAVGIG